MSEAQWRAQKEREQYGARQAGRIGYIGNAGATAGVGVHLHKST